MKNEFVLAFNEVLEDKGLPKETILEALKTAMVSAYRKSENASSAQGIEAQLNLEKGEFIILAEKEVVDSVENEATEVALEDAKKVKEDAQVGDLVMVDSTPENFGRVAAQTARQVIQQKIREAEHAAQYEYYEKQLGEIISGVVQAANSRGLTVGLELKAEGTMPRKEMIPHEHFRIHERVRSLVAEVKETGRGPQIILSRTHRDFLRRLLENEVPEIFHGVVEIRSIAREPGYRAKVAVSAAQNGIDPVGACVGMRGVRIQAIVRELHDEKIDVIEWNPEPTAFIAKAISPARVNGVFLHESIEGAKNALVVVPEDQLSLAIGRDGQNARLAAKLTGWRIDIKSLSEAISDWLFALSNNEEYKELAEAEKESIDKAEEIMARKSEGRILSNDDYDFLNAFNERLENVSQTKRAEKRAAYLEKREQILEGIPDAAFDMDLSESGLSDSIIEGLAEIKITNAGNLILTAGLKPEKIMDVSGIGPKTFESIEEFGKKLPDLVPEVEEIEEEPIVEDEAPVAEAAEEAEGAETPEAETDAEAAEAEATPDETGEGEAETEQAAAEVAPQEPEEDADEGEKKVESVKSFEELFKLNLESIDSIDPDEEDGEPSGKKSKKKRSKKSRRIEYDPDLDMTIAKKKHKRSDGEWDEWEVDI